MSEVNEVKGDQKAQGLVIAAQADSTSYIYRARYPRQVCIRPTKAGYAMANGVSVPTLQSKIILHFKNCLCKVTTEFAEKHGETPESIHKLVKKNCIDYGKDIELVSSPENPAVVIDDYKKPVGVEMVDGVRSSKGRR